MSETEALAVENDGETGDLGLDLAGDHLQEDEGRGEPVLHRDLAGVPLAEVQDRNSPSKLVSALKNRVNLSSPNFVQSLMDYNINEKSKEGPNGMDVIL